MILAKNRRAAWVGLLSSRRRTELTSLLYRSMDAEHFHYHLMVTARTVEGINVQLAKILDIREERAGILLQLGRHRESRQLAEDTAMRRTWGPADPGMSS